MFWRRKPPTVVHQSPSETVIHLGETEVPRYPPFMKGLPVVGIDRLLASQQELIDRIADSAMATPQQFHDHYLAAIGRFAGFAHLLPASQSHHHRGAGGLLRHALEVGLWALQSADRVLMNTSISAHQRRDMEPRWQLAVFLAGLCHDAGKPATDLVVTDKERNSTWQPIREDLHAWANRERITAYFLEWREGRGKHHTALSSLIADWVIGGATLTWIAEIDTDLVVWLMESLANNPGPTNPIHDLVRKADQTSVERDMRSFGVAMAGYELGVPVERHLADIMKRFVREGVWLVNVPGARLWHMDGHLYLVWPAGGEELARQVREDGIPGIPRTPDGLLDMLVERGMASLPAASDSDSPNQDFWQIAPAILAEKIPDIKLRAIRLINDGLVSTIPLPSVAGCLVGDEENTAKQVEIVARSDEAVAAVMDGNLNDNADASTSPPEMQEQASITPEHRQPELALDGAVGEALKALAQDVSSQDKQWGRHVLVDTQGVVWLRWPEAFAGYGLAPKQILEQLVAREWLLTDPLTPLKKTVPKSFVDAMGNAIGLIPELGRKFIDLSGGPPTATTDENDKGESGASAGQDEPSVEDPASRTTKPKRIDVAVASLDEVLVLLRSRGMVPEEDGYCRVPKKDVIAWLKEKGFKANYRLLWQWAQEQGDVFVLVEDAVKFRP